MSRIKKKLLKKIAIAAMVMILMMGMHVPQSSYARDSVYTKAGAGPKYWIAYEYCYTTNQPIPESRWQTNIDWVYTNFKPYGYDMVCSDGWIEGSQRVNSDGYIISYNDSWVNNWSYWSNYLTSKGMKLGIYYNPLWMTENAFNLNMAVKGTAYTTQNIVGETSFNSSLRWVDTAKPGAKEWIQNYVYYFKSVGAVYLRVDFLRDYENAYGTVKYQQALKWIKEAAGSDLFISLVMPNKYNHGLTELDNGDMMRVTEDCWNGGWDHISDRERGTWRNYWPQYMNAFDGFIGFADVTGRGQMIADGDFMRLHNCASDTERKFQVSLFTMAGSPIAIADQYDTIGNSAWAYQNTELIDLNNQGFVGKPLSYDIDDAYNSSRWVGQLPNGDWVVGLFNRENNTQDRFIDFFTDLGIEGDAQVRDLWSHIDLGSMSSYLATLAPHDCKILKITNPKKKYEAEVASLINGTKKNNNHGGYTGPGFVDKIETVGAKVLFAVNASSAGTYNLYIRYANGSGNHRTASLYVNDVKNSQINMTSLSNWETWSNVQKSVTLNAGINYIAIQYDSTDTGHFNLDFIQLNTVPIGPVEVSITNPGFENGNLTGWTEWHPSEQSACYGVDSYDAYSGNYKCYFWGTSAYEQSIHQLKTGLENGSYTVRAWVKQNSGTPTICRMELSNYGGMLQCFNIESSTEYMLVYGKVNVTNGQLDIGFYTKSLGNSNLQIDEVQLYRNY